MRTARLFGPVFTLILTCGVAWPQAVSTSQITGIVKDRSGAVLPGAEVAVTQTDTAARRSAVTNETGAYALANLPIGPYRLEASLPGFRTYVQSGIVLQVNSNPVINAILDVGQVSEQIEVQADAAMVETRSTGIGQVIDNQRVLELPLNGRQATELIYLTGMATPGGNASSLNSGVRNYPTVVVSVAGGLSNGMTYLLDGGTHNDPFNNLNLPLPFPDALQEFKVETSALPAQYGHHSAAAVNAVTKSGTNDFHGNVFEFLRNGSLNARNAFAATRDSLKRNQFGGTVGGPAVKNKLFFFGGYQGTKERSAPTANIAYVPTAAMLSGDFTQVTAAACNTSQRPITLTAPFSGNRISPSLLSPQALNLVKYLPATNDPCGQVKFGRNASSDEHILVGRMDYQWTDRHSLFGRYEMARLDRPTDYDGKNPLATANPTIEDRLHSFVLGDTIVLGSGTVSSFRGTLNRMAIPKYNPEFFSLADLGVQVTPTVPKFFVLSVNGGFSVGGSPANPGKYNTTSFQFAEDLSMIRGAHQMAFGGSFIHTELNIVSYLNSSGNYTFNGQNTSLGLADFMIGRPSNFQQASPSTVYNRQNYVGAYLQDTWKANSRLTVNAGVRWEPYLPTYSKNSYISHFDPQLFAQGVRSTIYKNAPAGLMFPGDPGFPGKKMGFARLGHFAPRLGMVWDPRGDGRMTIRAAYGTFFDLPNMFFFYSISAQNPPFGNVIARPNPANGFLNPWEGYPGGNPFPLTVTRDATFPLAGGYNNIPLDHTATYTNQWNLSVQRQVGADWLVSANYVGNNVIHMWTGNQVNPSVYIPGASTTANANQRRVFYLQNAAQGQYYGAINQLDDGGTAAYHGMLVSVQRRRSRGVTLQGNYTLSHCIGDLPNVELGVASPNYSVSNNRRADRGNCAQDRRHLLNLSTVVETPRFSSSVARTVLSSWQVSAIVRLQSGGFFSANTGLDNALTTGANQRANQVLANPYASEKTVDRWLDPAAFQQPANGTAGNMGINTLLGPGRITIDAGLTRSFQIREGQTLQFRMEAFNLPNHLNPNNPVSVLNNVNFGRIQSAGDPRLLQAALKFAF